MKKTSTFLIIAFVSVGSLLACMIGAAFGIKGKQDRIEKKIAALEENQEIILKTDRVMLDSLGLVKQGFTIILKDLYNVEVREVEIDPTADRTYTLPKDWAEEKRIN